MRTFEITSNCGRKIKVSESIIIHDNELYRLVSIDDNPVGWHWATKFFQLFCCLNVVMVLKTHLAMYPIEVRI